MKSWKVERLKGKSMKGEEWEENETSSSAWLGISWRKSQSQSQKPALSFPKCQSQNQSQSLGQSKIKNERKQ